MANLTSPYCDRHLTVIADAHVSRFILSEAATAASSVRCSLFESSRCPLTLLWLDVALLEANMRRLYC